MSSQAERVPAEAVATAMVSVVLIVFDDRDRLGRAVQSALSQPGPAVEVVVVDDASTDGTAEVAAEWARRDPRVRVVTRPSNSGGCGAPRNDGLDAATGRYVMFLDSDDELEPDAIGRLVEVAERTGVDVVLGRVERHNPHTGSVVPWQPALFERTGVTSTAERPELVGDTLVVDKLYRRELIEANGIRFPVDLHYEDLVFTARMYAATRSIAVTDVLVYRWYVRAADGDRSITNRRAELTNLVDRVEANRRADAVLREAGRADLRVAKDRKFVAHDLSLYLRDLPDRDERFRRGLLDVLAPYLGSLSAEVRDSAAQPGALMLALVAAGDGDGLVDAASLAYRRRVQRPLERSGERWLWPGVPEPAGDVTTLAGQLLRRGLHVDHTVTGVRVDAGRVRVTVSTSDPLGLLQDGTGLRLWVLVRAARHPRSLRLARVRRSSDETSSWEAVLPDTAALAAAAVPGEVQVRVLAWRRARIAISPLTIDPDAVEDIAFERRVGRRRRLVAGRATRTGSGHLALARTR